MSSSYEERLKEFFTSGSSKQEQVAASDAKEILNDDKKKKLLKDFIERLDKDSSNKPNSWIAIEYFDLLSTIQNLEDFTREKEKIKDFYLPQSELIAVAAVLDESTLNRFVREQKLMAYEEVGESYEYTEFKSYLAGKCKKKKKSRGGDCSSS